MKKMRNILFLSLLVMAGMSILFTACEEEDDYNYDNIIPKLEEINGPSDAIASGVTAYDYSVVHRGGSSYEWTVANNDAAIEKDPDYPNMASITYAQSPDSVKAEITVTETTMGGKSASVTETIQLLPYCPMDLGSWEGAYTENTDDGTVPTTDDVTITTDPGDELFGLIIVDFGFQSSWWGGFSGAELHIKMNGCTNEVTVPEQTIDEIEDFFGYGQITMVPSGKGSFTDNPKHIEFTAAVTVSAGSFGEVFYTYDKQ